MCVPPSCSASFAHSCCRPWMLGCLREADDPKGGFQGADASGSDAVPSDGCFEKASSEHLWTSQGFVSRLANREQKNVLADCDQLFHHLSDLEVQLAAAVSAPEAPDTEANRKLEEARYEELPKCGEQHAQLEERARCLRERSRSTVQQVLGLIGPLLAAHHDLQDEVKRVTRSTMDERSNTISTGVSTSGVASGSVETYPEEATKTSTAMSHCLLARAMPASLGSSTDPLEGLEASPADDEVCEETDRETDRAAAILAAARALLGARADGSAAKTTQMLRPGHGSLQTLPATAVPDWESEDKEISRVPMYTPRVFPPSIRSQAPALGTALLGSDSHGAAVTAVGNGIAPAAAGAEDPSASCRRGIDKVQRTSSLTTTAAGAVKRSRSSEPAPVTGALSVAQAPSAKVSTSAASSGPLLSARQTLGAVRHNVQRQSSIPRAMSPSARSVRIGQTSRGLSQARAVPTQSTVLRTRSTERAATDFVTSTGHPIATSPAPPGRRVSSPRRCHSGSLQRGRPGARPQETSPMLYRPEGISPTGASSTAAPSQPLSTRFAWTGNLTTATYSCRAEYRPTESVAKRSVSPPARPRAARVLASKSQGAPGHVLRIPSCSSNAATVPMATQGSAQGSTPISAHAGSMRSGSASVGYGGTKAAAGALSPRIASSRACTTRVSTAHL